MRHGRILVVGSKGFIGRHVVAEYARAGADVVGFDRDDPTGGDIADPATAERIVGDAEPELVIHAAGLVGSASESLFHSAHVRSTVSLLEAVARRAPSACVLMIGSAAELDCQPCSPFQNTGDRPTKRISVYGRSKLEQATTARRLARDRGIDLIHARLFNTLGPGQSTALVAGAMVERLAAVSGSTETPCLTVYDPEAVRDFLDVRDVARLIRHAADRLSGKGSESSISLCAGEGTSIAALAGELLAASGVPALLRFERAEGGGSRAIGDSGDLVQLLGGVPVRTITTYESLHDMWEYRMGRSTSRGSAQDETRR